ncbi:MAG TPA: bifunctional DNA-formamidopyrimidine glycosylase/DNA-(apurinic or apyrimidinic site) lyase [Candidatus Limnocylindrales bacterium]|nr:bifunctional DNA-formamidopyrimidine glycosylase/DNA-(apurinic or apyrimidinic site) lyase [Candidatus Limnocylindrales bacterium]
MPELPEVETVTRSITPLVGRRIVNAEFRCMRVLRGGDPQQMAERLRGRKIAGVKRYGKFIVVTLDRGGYFLIHLGMTGKLLLGGEPGKHTHGILTLDRGVLLYDDSRQFGCLQFSENFPARVSRLGPEPLEVAFEDFFASLHKHKTRIKGLLLNQKFVRGVGNIYADEALFRAGIHPLAMASRLRKDRAQKLFDAMREVLAEAIDAGGSSISDYVDAQGRKGFFQFSHRVYQRTGEPCISCGTPIRKVLVTQRSSHFCPKCQKR